MPQRASRRSDAGDFDDTLGDLDLRTQVLALLGVIVVLGGFFVATAWLGWDFARATVLIGAGIAFAATLRWRWGILAVLVYVTVEGLVGNLLYPETYPVLLKDGLIAGAYVGFGTSLLVRQEQWMVPRWVVYPFVALVALCVVESFNPRGYDPLVALVGFRVLVFYIPLFVLGFHLVRSGMGTDRLAVFLIIVSIPITAFGIAEYVAGPDVVAALGPGFARSIWIVGPEATSDLIFRPASTFAFVGHFGSYLLFLGVVGFAALHAPASLPGRLALTVAFALAGVAIVLQSQRTTWVLMPVAILLIYVLNRQLRGASRAAPVVLIAIALVATVGAPVLENRLPGLTSGVDPFANRVSPVLAGFAANLVDRRHPHRTRHGYRSRRRALRHRRPGAQCVRRCLVHAVLHVRHLGCAGLCVALSAPYFELPGAESDRSRSSVDGSHPASSRISLSRP